MPRIDRQRERIAFLEAHVQRLTELLERAVTPAAPAPRVVALPATPAEPKKPLPTLVQQALQARAYDPQVDALNHRYAHMALARGMKADEIARHIERGHLLDDDPHRVPT